MAAAKGLLYIGIDVSPDQVEANRKQVGPEGKWDFAYPPTESWAIVRTSRLS